MKTETYVKLFIGLVLFATLVALTVCHVQGADRLVDLIYAALLGLGIMHLGGPADGAAPAPDKQGGFARWPMLLLLAVFALALTGCASFQQAVQAYGDVAVTSAKAANDTALEAQKVALCATPFSALVRHPEMHQAVRSLCVDTHDANGAALIDSAAK